MVKHTQTILRQVALLTQRSQDLHCLYRKICEEREQNVYWYIMLKKFRISTSQEKDFPWDDPQMISSKIEPIFDDNFVLKAVGDLLASDAYFQALFSGKWGTNFV